MRKDDGDVEVDEKSVAQKKVENRVEAGPAAG